ncbi:limb region 1 protein homolog isoform X4 [Dipodomys spectabilis]|uniref:limb region 1 protein homolog isoform X4 n=1 Tax=Dipodomys spectabilis TaxID=105255 RepID=UPI001C539984|nr:limb region 1 protein homolog isoform X4 [Dipodomys spectabilis]
MEGQDEVSAREQHFHSQVRESTICFLIFAILYIVSYFIITRYKRKSDEQEDEDAIVNRISLFLSTFTLAVSAGTVLLLPFSIISNEILLSFPQNYYIQWLNGSLIHGDPSPCSGDPGHAAAARAADPGDGVGGVGAPRPGRGQHGVLVRSLGVLPTLFIFLYIIDGMFVTPLVHTGRSVPHVHRDGAVAGEANWLASPVEFNITELKQELDNVKILKAKLERRKKASAWERNLVYPAVMVLLLIETSISVLLVACNILCLLVDETAMPKGARGPGIGNASLSTFGFVGAALEIILIFYLLVSSVVGFYSLRFFENFTPKKDDTTMTKIIGNCVSVLILSSALPVMSRTLGITRFDLLGDFGRFNWLGNFYIVLSYNLLFAIVTTLCLVRKFTSAVREELFKALGLHKLHLSNASRDSESTKPSANGHQKAL